MSDSIHALAKARSECAAQLRAIEALEAEHAALIQAAKDRYQEAEDAYQRAISLLTTSELIDAGLKP